MLLKACKSIGKNVQKVPFILWQIYQKFLMLLYILEGIYPRWTNINFSLYVFWAVQEISFRVCAYYSGKCSAVPGNKWHLHHSARLRFRLTHACCILGKAIYSNLSDTVNAVRKTFDYIIPCAYEDYTLDPQVCCVI